MRPICQATEAGAWGAHERALALRAAQPREARKRGRGAGRGGGGTVFEGARRADAGVNEAMGESRAESLVRDVGEAVVSVAGESGAPGGGVTYRDLLLKLDLDATAGGNFDGLLGLVAEAVVLQAATGRPQGSDVGACKEKCSQMCVNGR